MEPERPSDATRLPANDAHAPAGGAGTLDRILSRVEGGLNMIAALILAAVMLIVASDVGMRYVFNRPYSWSYDLISMYLLTSIFYFSLSYTFASNGHIGVDLLQTRLGEGMRRVCQIVIGLSITAFFGVVAYLYVIQATADWAQGAVASGPIPWPSWVTDALVPVGSGVFALRGLLHAACHLVALLGGPELIALPPAAGSLEKVGFE